MTGRAARAGLVWLVLLAPLFGCISPVADVGTAKAECNPACGANQVCHPMLASCVGCAANGDCEQRNGGAQPFCDAQALSCVECRTKKDCHDPTPVCDHGSCVKKPDDHGGAGSGGDDNQAGAGGHSNDTAGAGDT